jgi:hypothetical protein
VILSLKVNYDTASWLLLVAALEAGEITDAVNVATLISDGAQLCTVGLVDEDVCFALPFAAVSRTRSLVAWLAAAQNMHHFIGKAENKAVYVVSLLSLKFSSHFLEKKKVP